MQYEFYILAFITSVFLSLLFTPIVGSLAIRFDAIDRPSGRKIHRKSIPLWGGVAVFVGIFGTILVLKQANPEFNKLLSQNSYSLTRTIEGILVGAIVVTILGMVDDMKSVAAPTKLLGQIIAAMIVMQYGIRIKGVNLPFFSSYLELPMYLSIIITVLWIIIFINSINLIDGIDGLATGVTGIAMVVFFAITIYQISIQSESTAVDSLKLASVLSLVVGGGCIGFLKFNFPPGKIFLGDSGSLLLGYMAGVVTIIGILKTAATFTLIVPILIFGVPVWDAFFSFLRRIFRKKSVMEADKDHLHHRLLYRRGWNEKKVDICIYSVTLILGAIAFLVAVF
ncbi:MAG: glycosyltransferase family 4 protein [Elusimicrobiota bacterium]